MPRRWDETEVRYLIKHAGRDTVTDIAAVLSRQRHDVRRECAVRGLNASTPRSSLFRCPECGSRRARRTRSRDVCRVCTVNEAVKRTETRIALELAAAPAAIRGRFGSFCGVRGPAAPPPRMPSKPSTVGMTPTQAVAAIDKWLAEVEAVELAAAFRRYAAARQQLHRLRVAIAKETR